jgi:nucleotide-binding universal stress UspA family protein
MNAEIYSYKVVVGYDFTEQSDTALMLAVESLQGKRHPELHAVYASPEHSPQAEAILIANQKELSQVLQKVAESFPGPITLYAHALKDTPAKAILKLAAEVESDAIFVGTHSRKGLSRLILGSVAEQVMRLASCAVTVAKEPSYSDDKHDDLLLLEPPCEKCITGRRQSNGEKWWCDTHSKPSHAPHRHSFHGDKRRTAKIIAMY